MGRIPHLDKILHFMAGAVVYAIFFMLLESAWFAGFFVLVAGTAKEVYDEIDYDGADHFDALATFAGGAVAALLFYIGG